MKRRAFLKASLTMSMLPWAMSRALAQVGEIRIGYQKNGVFYLAKATGKIDEAFKAKGVAIKWIEFSFGPPLLEALNLGAIDYGYTGDAPPIFAQAAGARIVYVAAQEAAGAGAGLLVHKNSKITQLNDLRGRKIGFAKASSAHNLVLAALDKAGLSYQDITPIPLAPADGASAFARSAIDVWSIWDPFFAVAENGQDVEVLATAAGIAKQNSFVLANADFTEKNPQLVAELNACMAQVGAWVQNHRQETAGLLSQASGIDLTSQFRAVNRTEFLVTPVSDAVIAEQQRVADRFFQNRLIAQPINVKQIVWNWKSAG